MLLSDLFESRVYDRVNKQIKKAGGQDLDKSRAFYKQMQKDTEKRKEQHKKDHPELDEAILAELKGAGSSPQEQKKALQDLLMDPEVSKDKRTVRDIQRRLAGVKKQLGEIEEAGSWDDSTTRDEKGKPSHTDITSARFKQNKTDYDPNDHDQGYDDPGFAELEKRDIKRLIDRRMKLLNANQRAVLSYRYGLGNSGQEMSQSDIARMFNVSKSRINNIEKIALSILKPESAIGEAEETLDTPNISTGDEVKVGKFKNSKATVKGFKKDKHGQPVLKTNKGDKKLFNPRVSKLEPKGE
jgi:DNA-directed RNA polymerase sigma subunit (sigma70/sigma32)